MITARSYLSLFANWAAFDVLGRVIWTNVPKQEGRTVRDRRLGGPRGSMISRATLSVVTKMSKWCHISGHSKLGLKLPFSPCLPLQPGRSQKWYDQVLICVQSSLLLDGRTANHPKTFMRPFLPDPCLFFGLFWSFSKYLLGVCFKPSRVGRNGAHWTLLRGRGNKEGSHAWVWFTPDLEKKQQKDIKERPRSWAITLLETPTALLILLILCVPLASQRIRHF